MDDDTLNRLESELDELRERGAGLDQQLAAGCGLLIAEFSRRYPPLKRVSELELRPDTLRKWLEEHRERRP